MRIEHHELAVHQQFRQLCEARADLWVTGQKIGASSGDKTSFFIPSSGQHAKAVVFQLEDPARTVEWPAAGASIAKSLYVITPPKAKPNNDAIAEEEASGRKA